MDKHAALDELRQARFALVRWRQYAQGLTSGMAVGARAAPVEAHECVLGQWFHGKGRELLGHLPQYHTVKESHTRLHEIHSELHDLVADEQHEHIHHAWQRLTDVYHEILDGFVALERHLGEHHAAGCAA